MAKETNRVPSVVTSGQQLELDYREKYSLECFKQYETAVKSILRGMAVLGISEEIVDHVMRVLNAEVPEVAAHAPVGK